MRFTLAAGNKGHHLSKADSQETGKQRGGWCQEVPRQIEWPELGESKKLETGVSSN